MRGLGNHCFIHLSYGGVATKLYARSETISTKQEPMFFAPELSALDREKNPKTREAFPSSGRDNSKLISVEMRFRIAVTNCMRALPAQVSCTAIITFFVPDGIAMEFASASAVPITHEAACESKEQIIPFCRSEFLQDFSIELGSN